MKITSPRFSRRASKIGHAALAFALSAGTMNAAVANVNLASAPVFLKESVDPNLVFVFDDSGSMGWEYMPDSVGSDLGLYIDNNGPFTYRDGNGNFRSISVRNYWYYSSAVNTVYYDPNIAYRPPFKPDGTGRRPDSNFTSAWVNGYSQTGSVDLANRYQTSRFDFRNGAFYYQFNSSASCDTNPKNNSCYSLVFLANESAEQQQNFANWFSYYRLRYFASRAGISEAFFDLPENIRVGYGAINSNNNTIDGVTGNTLISGVRPFNTNRRNNSWIGCKPRTYRVEHRCGRLLKMWAHTTREQTIPGPGEYTRYQRHQFACGMSSELRHFDDGRHLERKQPLCRKLRRDTRAFPYQSRPHRGRFRL